MLGFGMIAVFGFLTFRNFATGKRFWGALTSLGLVLGMASVWVDYQRSTTPPLTQNPVQGSSNPWAKDG